MGEIHNPHDQFFKTMLSNSEAAKVYLRAFLPDHIQSQLNLETLIITSTSFLNSDLSNYFADLILECKLSKDLNQNILIALLYEHKSNPYKYTVFQSGGYIFDAYRQQIADKTNPLKLIIPVIYYHGVRNWNPGNIGDHFHHVPETFKNFVPEYEYIFQNLSLLSDEEIRRLKHHLLVPGLLMQKYFKNLDMLQNLLEVIFTHLDFVEDSWNDKKSYFVYLFELFGHKKDVLMSAIDELALLTKDRTKNYILQLMEEGMEKGMENAIIKLLQTGVSADFICEKMEVSPELVERIMQKIDRVDGN